MTAGVETIADRDGNILAYVIPHRASATETSFVTPAEAPFQVGFVVYPAGGEVVRHVHLPLERHLNSTSEVVVVRSGRCSVSVYDSSKNFVASRELAAGDVLLLLAGGHGFHMDDDTVLLEVKQGPYTGLDEKERF